MDPEGSLPYSEDPVITDPPSWPKRMHFDLEYYLNPVKMEINLNVI